jgi:hypothetical protein
MNQQTRLEGFFNVLFMGAGRPKCVKTQKPKASAAKIMEHRKQIVIPSTAKLNYVTIKSI